MSEAGAATIRGRIDVWLVTPGERQTFGTQVDPCELLDAHEREALRRLRVATSRRNYLTSHLLLRLVLSRASVECVPPAAWKFDRSMLGRPAVSVQCGLPPLDFSLSRSSGLSVVAIAHDAGCRVGVDAERTDSPLTCIPADVALSPAEREHVEGVSSLHQPQEFLKLWTLKEAYMKLRGCGVGVGLEQVEVALSPARLVRTEEGHEPPTDLHLETRPIHTAAGVYCVSLAVQCPPGVRPQVTFHLLETLWPDPREGRRLPVEGVVESRPDEEAR